MEYKYMFIGYFLARLPGLRRQHIFMVIIIHRWNNVLTAPVALDTVDSDLISLLIAFIDSLYATAW